MLRIAEEMHEYGAKVENVAECASLKSIVQKKGMYLNDVGYRIWPSNYAKHMRQHNATATSVGRWRVGPKDQGYGRFARALEQKTGKIAMRLSLTPNFASAHRDVTSGALNVTLRVVYFDVGDGRWTLSYRGTSGARGTAMTVSNGDTGRWKVAKAIVLMVPTDASGANHFDFELRSLNKKNEVFSVIEVLVNTASAGSANTNFT